MQVLQLGGNLNDSADILIINENSWDVEAHSTKTVGSYELLATTSGNKLILAKRIDGEIISYGSVNPLLIETEN